MSFFGTKVACATRGARRTVADVMASFHRTLDELKQVELEHRAEAGRHAEVAKLATDNCQAALAEADQASAVAVKLQSLIAA